METNSGDATVETTGKIQSDTAAGIRVITLNTGGITITANGEIDSDRTGIYAESFSGNHKIDNEAAITAGGSGIRSVTSRTFSGTQAGEVEITNKADIYAESDGIFVDSGWFNVLGADVTVANTGSISSGVRGIYVLQSSSDNSDAITITSGSAGQVSTIESGSTGIGAHTDGSVSITNFDNIHAQNSYAIRAYSRQSAVTVATSGTLTGRSGVAARSRGVGDVQVVNTGLIDARTDGIFAMAEEGSVSVDNRNDVTVLEGSGI